MLDGSELNHQDYATMFMQYPRESVIYHFLDSHHLNEDIKHIFYLLTQKERKQMIDQMLRSKIDLRVDMLWPYLNVSERKYIIGNYKSKNMNKDLSTLYDMMSTEERLMVMSLCEPPITHVKNKRKGEKS